MDKKVLIACTAYGGGNIGDEAILHSLVKGLRENDISNIKVLTIDPLTTQERLNVKTARMKAKDLIVESLRSDAIICGGATVLSDYTRSFFIRSILARIFGKKMIYLGIGANKISDDFITKTLIKMGIFLSSYIAVRDLETKQELIRIGIKKDVDVMGDPAHIVGKPASYKFDAFLKKYNLKKEKQYLAIALSGEPDFMDKIPIEEISNAIKKISETYNLFPVFIAMNFREDQDINVLIEVQKRVKNGVVIQEDIEPELIAELTNYFKLVVSTRLHLVILSSTNSVPSIGIARGNKMMNMLNRLNLPLLPEIKNIKENDIVEAANEIMNHYDMKVKYIEKQIDELKLSNEKIFKKIAHEI